MFACEACGHPLNVHAPCNATVSKRKNSTVLCRCPAFEPADLQARVASITDTADGPNLNAIAALMGQTRAKS